MSLWAHLEKELVLQGVKGTTLLRAQSAIKSLRAILGNSFVLPKYDADLADKVTIPGDPNVYIVFGTWADGSVDIIKEGGMFPSDVLTGWKHGQTRAQYNSDLDSDDAQSDTDRIRGGEAPKEVPREPLPVVSGGRVRGGKFGRGGEDDNHPWRIETDDHRGHGPKSAK